MCPEAGWVYPYHPANPLEHLAPSPPAEIMNAIEFVQAAPPEARFLFHAHPASGSNFFVMELRELGIGDILHEVPAWPSRVVSPKVVVTWEDVRPPEGVKRHLLVRNPLKVVFSVAKLYESDGNQRMIAWNKILGKKEIWERQHPLKLALRSVSHFYQIHKHLPFWRVEDIPIHEERFRSSRNTHMAEPVDVNLLWNQDEHDTHVVLGLVSLFGYTVHLQHPES